MLYIIPTLGPLFSPFSEDQPNIRAVLRRAFACSAFSPASQTSSSYASCFEAEKVVAFEFSTGLWESP